VFKVVRNLVQNTTSINLRWNTAREEDVHLAAQKRFFRGFPPRKRGDTSMGDAINWEWIILCAKQVERDVVTVSRDGDYGLRFDGKYYLNDWLQQEFRNRVLGRKKIEFTTSLTQTFRRLSVEVTPAEEAEEARIIAQSESKAEPLIIQLWPRLVESVARGYPFHRVYLEAATPIALGEGVLTIGFRPEVHDFCDLIDNAKSKAIISSKVRDFGHTVSEVRFVKL
jgi:hypothetical protein